VGVVGRLEEEDLDSGGAAAGGIYRRAAAAGLRENGICELDRRMGGGRERGRRRPTRRVGWVGALRCRFLTSRRVHREKLGRGRAGRLSHTTPLGVNPSITHIRPLVPRRHGLELPLLTPASLPLPTQHGPRASPISHPGPRPSLRTFARTPLPFLRDLRCDPPSSVTYSNLRSVQVSNNNRRG
jgi:hypothetical protein